MNAVGCTNNSSDKKYYQLKTYWSHVYQTRQPEYLLILAWVKVSTGPQCSNRIGAGGEGGGVEGHVALV